MHTPTPPETSQQSNTDTGTLPLDQILCGDNLELIQQLPDQSVQLVITSPPYFQQRDYGAGIGNEDHLAEHLNNLLCLFNECVRVAKDDGSLVFNLGDKYENSSLLLVPYRFAIAATETGLVKLVNNVTWVKRNPTPRQFRRRLVSSTEPFFHFVKSEDYFYNLDAFMVGENAPKKSRAQNRNVGRKYFELIDQSDLSDEAKCNARLALTQVIQEVHCGQIAGLRMKIRGIHAEPFGGQNGGRKIQLAKNGFTIIRIHGNKLKRDVIATSVESIKGIQHPAIYPVKIVEEFLSLLTRPGDLVLDPFVGSGSTAVACRKLGRHFIGYDINPEYCEAAHRRVSAMPTETMPLFRNSY